MAHTFIIISSGENPICQRHVSLFERKRDLNNKKLLKDFIYLREIMSGRGAEGQRDADSPLGRACRWAPSQDHRIMI